MDSTPTPPAILRVLPDNIPLALKCLPVWVLWRNEYDAKREKWTKPPYSIRGHHASSTDPRTWTTYDKALRSYARPSGGWDGIGVALEKGRRLTGVDLDHCVDESTGEIAEWALQAVKRLNSYTERSPSGHGLRIFVFADLPPEGRKQGDIEVYEWGRYLTVTGQHLDGTPNMIEERSAELAEWHAETFVKSHKAEPKERADPSPLHVSDEQLIEVATSAKNGGNITDLMAGRWEGRYRSQSEADSALCCHLAFYAQGDASRVDRMFRASGLMRDKWDEPHFAEGKRYGEGTIENALGVVTEYWTPPESYRRFEAAHRNGGVATDEEEAQSEPSIAVPIYLPTDQGNAERLKYQYGKDIRYCHTWRKWLVWDGKRWAADETAETGRMAVSVAKSLWKEVGVEEDTEKRKRLIKHAFDTESNRNIKAMLSLSSALPGIPVVPSELDADPWLLCCDNGVVNLRTGRLMAAKRARLITKITPYPYDPEAQCPLFMEFLDTVFDRNARLIEFIRRAVGYTLTGSTRERCLFICHGTGDNGKTVLLDVLQAMMGGYGQRTPSETLMAKRDSAIPNDIAALKGARYVFASETEEGRRLAVALVKDITGGEEVSARFMHGEWFSFRPEFKVWLATNHKPRITDSNLAIWNRIRLVPFSVTIPKEEQDRQLATKLKEEIPGILAWAVRGCLAWNEDGLEEPEEVTAATESYRQEQDMLTGFLGERCVQTVGVKCGVTELYERYVAWSGDKSTSQRALGIKIGEMGYTKKRSGPNGEYEWAGIGLVSDRSEG